MAGRFDTYIQSAPQTHPYELALQVGASKQAGYDTEQQNLANTLDTLKQQTFSASNIEDKYTNDINDLNDDIQENYASKDLGDPTVINSLNNKIRQITSNPLYTQLGAQSNEYRQALNNDIIKSKTDKTWNAANQTVAENRWSQFANKDINSLGQSDLSELQKEGYTPFYDYKKVADDEATKLKEDQQSQPVGGYIVDNKNINASRYANSAIGTYVDPRAIKQREIDMEARGQDPYATTDANGNSFQKIVGYNKDGKPQYSYAKNALEADMFAEGHNFGYNEGRTFNQKSIKNDALYDEQWKQAAKDKQSEKANYVNTELVPLIKNYNSADDRSVKDVDKRVKTLVTDRGILDPNNIDEDTIDKKTGLTWGTIQKALNYVDDPAKEGLNQQNKILKAKILNSYPGDYGTFSSPKDMNNLKEKISGIDNIRNSNPEFKDMSSSDIYNIYNDAVKQQQVKDAQVVKINNKDIGNVVSGAFTDLQRGLISPTENSLRTSDGTSVRPSDFDLSNATSKGDNITYDPSTGKYQVSFTAKDKNNQATSLTWDIPDPVISPFTKELNQLQEVMSTPTTGSKFLGDNNNGSQRAYTTQLVKDQDNPGHYKLENHLYTINNTNANKDVSSLIGVSSGVNADGKPHILTQEEITKANQQGHIELKDKDGNAHDYPVVNGKIYPNSTQENYYKTVQQVIENYHNAPILKEQVKGKTKYSATPESDESEDQIEQ